MSNERDEIAATLERMVQASRNRGYATWFHAPSDLKRYVEVDTVAVEDLIAGS